MLVTTQKSIQTSKGKQERQKERHSSKTRRKGKKKGKKSVVKPRGGIAKFKGKAMMREEQDKRKYFFCQGDGHWKRNCPKFLESLKTKGKGKDGEGETFSSLYASKCSNSSSNA